MNPLAIHISTSHRPEVNLAYEEYLLEYSKDDILLFYINDRSVIFGKHQNPWKEINLEFCRDNHISVHRRLSGGGAVYHDINNLNFSYIRNKEADFVNFKEHIEPISSVLLNAGILNNITERNDIFINHQKISGNAEHVNNRKKRILHHGTLLVSSDLDLLRAALNPPEIHITTHAVSSVKSKVTSIDQHSSFKTAKDLLEHLVKALPDLIRVSNSEQINPENIPEVLIQARDKYTNWEWNYGYSPQFEYCPNEDTKIIIRKGKIIDIESGSLPKKFMQFLMNKSIQETLILGKLPENFKPFYHSISLI